MKLFLIAGLMFMTTGCTALLTGQRSADAQAGTFQTAMDQLLQDNNPKPMQAFVKEHPESQYADEAGLLLQLHDAAKAYRSKSKSCDQQLESSRQEIRKLQEDIERLTQLNLEMDRSPQ